MKYRQLLDEAMVLDRGQIALLALLMLRGAQTPGELRARSERLHDFSSVAEVDDCLEALASRSLAVRFERRPGQKEARWGLDGPFLGEAAAEVADDQRAIEPVRGDGDLDARVAHLERELDELRGVVAQLRELVE